MMRPTSAASSSPACPKRTSSPSCPTSRSSSSRRLHPSCCSAGHCPNPPRHTPPRPRPPRRAPRPCHDGQRHGGTCPTPCCPAPAPCCLRPGLQHPGPGPLPTCSAPGNLSCPSQPPLCPWHFSRPWRPPPRLPPCPCCHPFAGSCPCLFLFSALWTCCVFGCRGRPPWCLSLRRWSPGGWAQGPASGLLGRVHHLEQVLKVVEPPRRLSSSRRAASGHDHGLLAHARPRLPPPGSGVAHPPGWEGCPHRRPLAALHRQWPAPAVRRPRQRSSTRAAWKRAHALRDLWWVAATASSSPPFPCPLRRPRPHCSRSRCPSRPLRLAVPAASS
mmetsp:Transcript_13240/g.40953  ORF Transcript_13240/g.40953 Transcript_13240/m.40953 type:complete len:330 (+) Transcript_13240:924-1913(+)